MENELFNFIDELLQEEGIKYISGHRDKNGDPAPWVVLDKPNGKEIKCFKSGKEAKEYRKSRKMKPITEEFLLEYIVYKKGNKNSKGEEAPWMILSQKGKKIASESTRAKAVKRLREIEYFKNK